MTRIWDAGRSACCIILAAATLTAAAAAQAPQFGNTEKKSWNPFKKDTNKLPANPTPPSDPNDPTSLSNKKKPDANFYASWGELEERGGRHAKALELYQRALKEDKRNLAALLGAARMKDATDRHDEALNYYRQALRAHPNEAPVYNDLGLSCGRAGQYPQAIQAFQRAVQIDSERKLYRNNLANVMIDAGQVDQALFHLQQAHGEALGHFNLGYLMAQKQRPAEAAECFARAGELDPSLGVPPDLQERLAMRDRTRPTVAAPEAPVESDVAPYENEAQFAPPSAAMTGDTIGEDAIVEPQATFSDPEIVESAPAESAPAQSEPEADFAPEPAAEAPLLDFGQPETVENFESAPTESTPLIESEPLLETAAPEAPLSEPILPEANVSPAPAEVDPGPGTVYESPRFAEQDTYESAPLAPVVRAAPGSQPTPADSAAMAPSGRAVASGSRHDGRPALPPRPSAVQLYRQHVAHSDQAPTPEAVFPPYDPTRPVDSYDPAPTAGESVYPPATPHVGRRPAPGHQPPQRRSARSFKNPFSGIFGTPKSR